MKAQLLALALVGFFAATAAAQEAPYQSTNAAHVTSKVSKSLARSVKISGDSAMAIAKANADLGEVSSADLEMQDKHLVYNVKVLNKSKGATNVSVDAMTGEVIKDHTYGGVKAALVHNQENKKLLNAKRDSAYIAP